jgi:hypothetical protein
MNDADLATYVAGEVRDLLRAGPVGLYEFLDYIRADKAARGRCEQIRVAQASLDLVRSTVAVVFLWELWAQQSETRPAPDGYQPEDSDWTMPDSGRYLSIVRADYAGAVLQNSRE